jgi:galactonate dehydratase
VEIIAAVRDAVGPEVDIMAEGHNRFSAHTALQLAEAMTPYQPAWFETPVPPHLISSIVRGREAFGGGREHREGGE